MDVRELLGDDMFIRPDDVEHLSDRALAVRVRNLTRLTLFAIDGMLLDADGSELEKDDVRMIQQVAWAADHYAWESRKRSDRQPEPAGEADPGRVVDLQSPRRPRRARTDRPHVTIEEA